MNRFRRAWPVARIITVLTAACAGALLALTSTLAHAGWIDADGFDSGVRGSVIVLLVGLGCAGLSLLAAAIFYDDKDQ
ncbi:hypothetical protein ACIP5Y_21315 [Nocardia sp. NPDC088792]|uniref:hypothetical protein n=1 Tax=Nocardia sp. NPDC088792 TaxID=3364332 RepID=UPI0037F3D8C7